MSGKRYPEAGSHLFPPEALGPALRELRERRGISAPEAAAAAGLSRFNVTSYERGQITPSVGSLSQLLKALGFNLIDLQKTLDRQATAAEE
jgi:transcriptional regulator with XRE-family HTH domain